jgi:hypothetical protein
MELSQVVEEAVRQLFTAHPEPSIERLHIGPNASRLITEDGIRLSESFLTMLKQACDQQSTDPLWTRVVTREDSALTLIQIWHRGAKEPFSSVIFDPTSYIPVQKQKVPDTSDETIWTTYTTVQRARQRSRIWLLIASITFPQ